MLPRIYSGRCRLPLKTGADFRDRADAEDGCASSSSEGHPFDRSSAPYRTNTPEWAVPIKPDLLGKVRTHGPLLPSRSTFEIRALRGWMPTR